jgi:hypothetical protein
MTAWDYVTDAVTDPLSALLVSGGTRARCRVPRGIPRPPRAGRNRVGRANVPQDPAGHRGISPATLNRALQLLTAKRIVEAAVPLSAKPSRETRYTVADPHLRFWLAFLSPHQPEIERCRGDLVAARVRTSWTAWRGTASRSTSVTCRVSPCPAVAACAKASASPPGPATNGVVTPSALSAATAAPLRLR